MRVHTAKGISNSVSPPNFQSDYVLIILFTQELDPRELDVEHREGVPGCIAYLQPLGCRKKHFLELWCSGSSPVDHFKRYTLSRGVFCTMNHWCCTGSVQNQCPLCGLRIERFWPITHRSAPSSSSTSV